MPVEEQSYDIIVVTGPTASGKTRVAAAIASAVGGEVVSADSRQVYRRMDIGTGKDYDDYVIEGKKVPCHLIDIVEPGYRYNVFEYQRDFLEVYHGLVDRGVVPVVCGGSGMYLDSVVSGYRMYPVPVNEELRSKLADYDLEKLKEILAGYRKLHNYTDVDTVKRAIRAIEIEVYHAGRAPGEMSFPALRPLVTAISYNREERRRRISERLRERLSAGMVEEVAGLLDSGVPSETLDYYGLEYKFITRYLTGKISYDVMVRDLETAICQFAKRQMTWFRGMERKGVRVHWIDGNTPFTAKVGLIVGMWQPSAQ